MIKWTKPYNGGRASLARLHRHPGVYFIRDKDRRLLYVGRSHYSVYKALYRHFYLWDTKHVWYERDVVLGGMEVAAWVLPRDWVSYVEARLIRMFSPADNRKFYTDDEILRMRPFGSDESFDSYLSDDSESLPF